MIKTKKKFTIKKSELGSKFRVENNNLDLGSILEQSNFSVVTLREIATYQRENRNTSKSKDLTFKYVQISDIDVSLGTIKSCTVYKGSEAPNNARRIMRKDDVLVSTRRPTRGAIVSVSDIFDGEICSIFFTVLRVKDKSLVNPAFLAIFLRTSFCRFQFENMITETAYPVISDDDVLDMIILLPSLEEQLTIVSMYEGAVKNFNSSLNSAHKNLIFSKQSIENFVLKNEAEKLTIPSFGLQMFDSSGKEVSVDSIPTNHAFRKNAVKTPNLEKYL